jgi:Schlafen, AlbA_2
MWIPRDWNDLKVAIGVQVEGEALDFKSSFPPKGKMRDLAKDAASMSIGGGVIVIGVGERNRVATEITPIALNGAEERVRQVIDAAVSPPLHIDINTLSEYQGDDHGVLVITVPASWSAPHQHDDRFPARSGSTTRFLAERELEALYRRRDQLRQSELSDGGILRHKLPPGLKVQLPESAGLMRLQVTPIGGARSSLEPHLRQPLGDSVLAAVQPISEYLSPRFDPKTFDFLGRWSPAGTDGWCSGESANGALPDSVTVGAMFGYESGFSFSTAIELGADTEKRCSHEHHWAIEAMAQLCIAGQFFCSMPEASLLRIDVELGGLLGCVSWQASHGLAFNSNAPRVSNNQYVAGGTFATRDLADDPRYAVRALLDPFMVAILTDGSDLVSWIRDGRY